VKKFLALDERRRELLAAVETMRAKRNAVSKDVPTLKGKEKDAAIADMKKLGEELKAQEEELAAAEQEWMAGQYMLPMIPHASVPVGKDDSENVEACKWGAPKEKPAHFKDHVTLGIDLDIIDIPRGAKVAGSRLYFLKGDGALLHNAVLRYTIDHLTKKGWQLFTPPYLATRDCFVGTGFFPGADESNIYALGGQAAKDNPIESDGLHLIGTSEVTVASYHKDEVLTDAELPKRYAGFSPCFRREAGTYGKDTHGLYRVHQFEKVEQVVLCEADEEKGMAMFEEIRTNAEEVLRALELPYRVLTVCTGDMGKGKFFMQDIETWMPSRNAYGETHSCSYLKDFQARRLNIKYIDPQTGQKKFVHTLNNTCIASPRILIPILETYQNKDGTVTVPEVLRPYMHGKHMLRKI
jgi:seryl-tRNA synthetase